jgi:dTDP-4-amino-4,6-dideoxygalactose transaminase
MPDRIICLPFWPGLADEDAQRVIAAIKKNGGV